jgi:hypothetical protein
VVGVDRPGVAIPLSLGPESCLPGRGRFPVGFRQKVCIQVRGYRNLRVPSISTKNSSLILRLSRARLRSRYPRPRRPPPHVGAQTILNGSLPFGIRAAVGEVDLRVDATWISKRLLPAWSEGLTCR